MKMSVSENVHVNHKDRTVSFDADIIVIDEIPVV